MSKIISVIPNICEGTDKAFIDDVTERLKAITNLAILDVSMDKTRNRTVFAFTGTREAIFEGGFLLYEEAGKHIDMRKHKGEYPRIGAVDVVPFVPLKDVTIEETIELSVKFAEEVVKRFNVSVYLYAESARLPLRKDIERIRQCQYEGLEEQLKVPRWKPDLGPDTFNPDFGATIIGARFPLVSFKINLTTHNIETARSVCKSIQYAGGGLRFVTANSGVVEDEHRFTQITVSISNYQVTPIYKVVEMARMEAQRYAADIKSVEMIGLIPQEAFFESAMYYLRVKDFSHERLLENNIQRLLEEKDIFFT